MPVPEAEPAVGALRLELDWSAARGVPAHITLLFPFAPPDEVDEVAVAALVASHDEFDYELASIERFEDAVTWLRPVPDEPFAALTRAIAARWPEYPPYEGAHETVIPHLTVADTLINPDSADLGTLVRSLPIRAHAHDVLLLAEEEPGGRWLSRARFALRSAA